MTAIMASTVQVKTMADDTLRLTIDIDPQYAHEAFALFGKRGSPCAIARLTNDSAVEAMREAAPGVTPTSSGCNDQAPGVKGGPLARLAGIWCNDRRFWAWLRTKIGADVDTPEAAADVVREWCGISSRAELDNNEDAADNFHGYIREPFAEYLRGLE